MTTAQTTEMEENILQGFKTAVEGTTPAVDAGAPAQYVHLPSLSLLAQTVEDYAFTVKLQENDTGGEIVSTGIMGEAQYYLRVIIHLQHVNKGNDAVNFHAVLARAMRRLMDRILANFRTPGFVLKVDTIASDGWGFVEDDDENWATIAMGFTVKYHDTITTS